MTVFPTHLYIPNVYAGDLAEAMVTMLERPVAYGKAYNVAGDPEVSFWDMLRAYRQAGGQGTVARHPLSRAASLCLFSRSRHPRARLRQPRAGERVS